MVKPTSEKPATQRSDAKFKGVRKRKWGKFVSEIRLPNSRERIWLGSYDTAEKAARAFDAASFCLRGHSAKFNFPNIPPPKIGCGSALTPSEIQDIAARFANSEPPLTHSDQQSTSTSGLESDSPSLSVSDGTLRWECEWPVVEYSGAYNLDYGIFPGFDDFTGDVIGSSMTANIGDEEDNVDGIIVSESFLWNF